MNYHAPTKLGGAIASAAIAAAPTLAPAGTDTWFEPLTESAPVLAPNDLPELYAPWVTPEGILQLNIVSMREVEDGILSPLQSILRVPAGTSSSMIDMIAYDETGNYLFLPHETPFGAGCSRYNMVTEETEVLFAGDMKGADGDWSNDYGAFDPCRYTPNGTLLLGEEWTAEGRIIEVLNPKAPADEIEIRELDSIANVAHEGINFSIKHPRFIYYIDEWNSGSIYRFRMNKLGDFTSGLTEVLVVDGFESSGGVAEDNWNEQADGVLRTGPARWVRLTNAAGVPLPGVSDPFRNGPTNDPRSNDNTRGGRPAADDVGGTPYGRPEDMEVGTLANGNEVLYIAVTSENSIYSVEIVNSRTAHVRVFASGDTPKNLGYAPTTGALNSPDNLAQDACGNIYVIEDAPNGSSTGGDIWFARDVDGDGIAESLDHFMSITVDGSEATGMIFNPVKPTEYVVAVQHPDSTDLADVPDGLGDAVWRFDLSGIPNQEFVAKLSGTETE